MTETFRNLTEAYNIYRVYRKLNKQGILKKEYTLEEVYIALKKQKELLSNG